MKLETLWELFTPNFNEGYLTWNYRSTHNLGKGESLHSRCRWNTRYANTIAGTIDGGGYISVKYNGKRFKAHRIIFAMAMGKWPQLQIDHINHVKTDNRISNLREVSCVENSKNSSLRSDNKSGCQGVYWRERSMKWVATIHNNGVKVYLGNYKSFEDAVGARRKAQNDFGFHPNSGISS